MTAAAQVIVHPLPAVWQEIWQIVSLPAADQLQAIAGFVAGVTVDGLAAITGANPPRLDTIADRIVRGVASVIGPDWGAGHPAEPGIVAYVLPPIPVDAADELRTLLKDRNGNAIVAFSDTTCAGLTVVRTTFRCAKEVVDVMTELLERNLNLVLRDPQTQLYLPNGTRHLSEDLKILRDGQVALRELRRNGGCHE